MIDFHFCFNLFFPQVGEGRGGERDQYLADNQIQTFLIGTELNFFILSNVNINICVLFNV